MIEENNHIEQSIITLDNTLGFQVDEEILQEFLSCKRDYFPIDLDDDTTPHLQQNGEGNLVLGVDLPDRFYGCYYYNGGVFPYILKKEIDYLALESGDRQIVGRLVRCVPVPHTRFRFGPNPGDPSVADPDGDCCLWTLKYYLAPA